MKTATKNATKRATKVAATEPSADASPAHKNRIAAARKNRGAPPIEETAPTETPPATATKATEVPPAEFPAYSTTREGERMPSLADAVLARHEAAEEAYRASQPFLTLCDLGATWIEYLKANGATLSTWSGYARDLDVAYGFLDAQRNPAMISTSEVAAYEASDAVTKKKSGAPRAMPTILKTRRVLRLALTWAHGSGRLATLPYAKKAGAA